MSCDRGNPCGRAGDLHGDTLVAVVVDSWLPYDRAIAMGVAEYARERSESKKATSSATSSASIDRPADRDVGAEVGLALSVARGRVLHILPDPRGDKTG